MYCARCGRALPEGVRFCPACGAPVPRAVPRGKTPLPVAAPAAPPPSGEAAPAASARPAASQATMPAQVLRAAAASPRPVPEVPLAPNVPPRGLHLGWVALVAVIVVGLVGLGCWGAALEEAPASEVATARGSASALDDEGTPTFAALMLMDGSSLDDELVSHGWTWDGGQLLYSSRRGMALYVQGVDDHECGRGEIVALAPNGGDEPVMACLVVPDARYDSAADVLDALCAGLSAERAVAADGRHAAARVSDGDVADVAWVSWDGDDALWRVYLVGEAGIEAGVDDSYVWAVPASDVDEAWEAMREELEGDEASDPGASDAPAATGDGGVGGQGLGGPLTQGRPLSGDPAPSLP